MLANCTRARGTRAFCAIFTRKEIAKTGRLPHNQPSIGLYGPLAQRIRASDYGSEGHRFESYRAHFFVIGNNPKVAEIEIRGARCDSTYVYLLATGQARPVFA